jgi:hypothetical protein
MFHRGRDILAICYRDIAGLFTGTSKVSVHDEVDMYRHKQNSSGIVAVQPNGILGRQYLFSPHIEPSIVIVWQNITYCSKKEPFSIEFHSVLTEIFAKGNNKSSNFFSRQPLVGPLRRQAAGETRMNKRNRCICLAVRMSTCFTFPLIWLVILRHLQLQDRWYPNTF